MRGAEGIKCLSSTGFVLAEGELTATGHGLRRSPHRRLCCLGLFARWFWDWMKG